MQSSSPIAPARHAVPTRKLGHTGEEVSLVGLGGFHLGTLPDEREAVRLVRSAVDRGVTFMDNSWDYHDGRSEEWMGAALRDGYRDRVYLMTKIDGRTRRAAEAQIDDCLRRLGTDRVDLMQFHEVIRLEDADRIFAEGGAMDAMRAAQQAGKVRHVGFTGHKDPFVHLRMLEVAEAHGVAFDAVQMPLNALDAHFRSFEKQVIPELVRRGIGVLGMKPLAGGELPDAVDATAIECLHYAMNLAVSVVITGMDSFERLDQALEAAQTFQHLSDAAVASLLGRTAEAARTGKREPFKTDVSHDATARNPQWLG